MPCSPDLDRLVAVTLLALLAVNTSNKGHLRLDRHDHGHTCKRMDMPQSGDIPLRIEHSGGVESILLSANIIRNTLDVDVLEV